MDKLLQDLSSPSWWMGVFVVGVLINIFSARLMRWWDGWASRRSERARQRSEERKQAFEVAVQRVMNDEGDARQLLVGEFRARQTALFLIIWSATFIMGAVLFRVSVSVDEIGRARQFITFLLGTSCGVFLAASIAAHNIAAKYAAVYNEAQKRKGKKPFSLVRL